MAEDIKNIQNTGSPNGHSSFGTKLAMVRFVHHYQFRYCLFDFALLNSDIQSQRPNVCKSTEYWRKCIH